MVNRWMEDGKPMGWADWRPAHAPTCRKGGCPAPASEESEWCAKHLDEVTAQRDGTRAQNRQGDRERGGIKQTMSISRAFGKVVVTVHGNVDAKLLRRTLAELVEDQSSVHLIIDLRDALLDQDSVGVLVGSAQRVQTAGGDLVLAARSLPIPDALEESGFTLAEAGGSFGGGPGDALFSLSRP